MYFVYRATPSIEALRGQFDELLRASLLAQDLSRAEPGVEYLTTTSDGFITSRYVDGVFVFEDADED